MKKLLLVLMSLFFVAGNLIAMEECLNVDEAILDENIPLLQAYINSGALSVDRSNDSMPYLMLAVKNQKIKAAEILLDNDKAKEKSKEKYNGETPLYVAIELGNYDLAALLLKHDQSVVAAMPFVGDTALKLAVKRLISKEDHTLRLVDLLLAHGADPNECCLAGGDTPFSLSVAANNYPLVRKLFHKGNANVNQQYSHTCTPLSIAVKNLKKDEDDKSDKIRIIKFLLRHGAIPNTALHDVILSKNLDCFMLLLNAQKRIQPDWHPEAALLQTAVEKDDVAMVKGLLDLGADGRNEEFIHAINGKKIKLLEVLSRKDGKPCIEQSVLMQGFEVALSKQQEDVIKILISLGIKENAMNNFNISHLLGTNEKEKRILKYLYAAGLNIKRFINYEDVKLLLYFKKGYLSLTDNLYVSFFLKDPKLAMQTLDQGAVWKGARNVKWGNDAEIKNSTPLHLACMAGPRFHKLAQKLIFLGSDVDCRNGFGDTPLESLMRTPVSTDCSDEELDERQKLVMLFCKYGADATEAIKIDPDFWIKLLTVIPKPRTVVQEVVPKPRMVVQESRIMRAYQKVMQSKPESFFKKFLRSKKK